VQAVHVRAQPCIYLRHLRPQPCIHLRHLLAQSPTARQDEPAQGDAYRETPTAITGIKILPASPMNSLQQNRLRHRSATHWKQDIVGFTHRFSPNKINGLCRAVRVAHFSAERYRQNRFVRLTRLPLPTKARSGTPPFFP
jgi:hypothetical protein